MQMNLQRCDAREKVSRVERERRRDSAGRNRVESLDELIFHHRVRLCPVPTKAIVVKGRMVVIPATAATAAATRTTTTTYSSPAPVVIVIAKTAARGGGGADAATAAVIVVV